MSGGGSHEWSASKRGVATNVWAGLLVAEGDGLDLRDAGTSNERGPGHVDKVVRPICSACSEG